jgi:hypothetical protein
MTDLEIVELFRTYRINLGQNDTQRDKIISHFQNINRSQFELAVKQVLDQTKVDLFEKVTVTPDTNEEGFLVIL